MEDLKNAILEGFKSENNDQPKINTIISTQPKEKLAEILNSYSKAEHETLWTNAFQCMENNLTLLTELSTSNNDDTLNLSPREECDKAAKTLISTLELLNIHISADKPIITASIGNINECLRRLLIISKNGKSTLRILIANYFVQWFTKDKPDKNTLGAQALFYFLDIAFEVKVEKTTWSSIETLLPVLNQSPIDYDVLSLIKKCFHDKAFHRHKKGLEILSQVLLLNEALLKDLHEEMKNNILTCDSKIGKIFGGIYYNAWKNSEGAMKATLETHCIENILFLAVHLSPQQMKALHALQNIMGVFNLNRTDPKTLCFLNALYPPVLWRNLSVANPEVRNNAAALLFDMVPLFPVNSDRATKQLAFQDQFNLIKKLLVDDAVEVRVCAIKGACRLLGLYWTHIPDDVLRSTLKILVTKLMIDSSSASVRCAVLKGFILIMENKLSHLTLKVVLRATAKMIHDSSEEVRNQYVTLLHRVRELGIVEYWSLVPMRHLLARLVDDDNEKILKNITSLILPCYFPEDEDAVVHLNQCAALVEKNRKASRKFLMLVGNLELLQLNNIVKFLQTLFEAIYNHCVKNLEQDDTLSSLSSSGDKENSVNVNGVCNDTSKQNKTDQEVSILEKNEIVAGLLDGATVLYTTIAKKLSEAKNKNLAKEFIRYLPKQLSPMFIYYKKLDKEIYHSLIYLCGLLPKDVYEVLSSTCISELNLLTDDSPTEEFVPFALSLICQAKLGALLDMISDWLQQGLKEPERESLKKTRVSKKRVHFKEPPPRKPLLAIRILRTLLNHGSARNKLLAEKKELIVNEILVPMKSLKDQLLLLAEGNTCHLSTEMLYEGFQLYCSMTILIFCEKDSEVYAPRMIEELLEWSVQVFLPLFDSEEEESSNKSLERPKRKINDKKDTDVANYIFETLLVVIADMFACGVVDSTFLSSTAIFVDILAMTEPARLHFLVELRIFKEAVEYVTSRQSVGTGDHVKLISNLFSSLCKNLKGIMSEEKQLSNKHMEMTRKALYTSFGKVISLGGSMIMEQCISIAMTAITAELYCLLEGTEDLKSMALPENLSQLPPVTVLLTLTMAHKRVAQMPALATEFCSCLRQGNNTDNVSFCLVTVVFFYAIYKDEEFRPLSNDQFKEVNDTALVLLRQLADSLDPSLSESIVSPDIDKLKLAGSIIKRLKKDLAT